MPAYVLSCAVAVGTQLERVARVDHTAADRLAGAALDLQRLAGEHRFIQHGHGVDDAPVHRHHFAGTHDQEVVHRHLGERYHVSPSEPIRRRANRGACSSSARRSCEARRSAAASSARPPASITAINAPARYSPTSSVPTSDNTAISPPRPVRAAAPQAPTAPRAPARTKVPAIQHASADTTPSREPRDSAGDQGTPTVTTTRAGSTSERQREVANERPRIMVKPYEGVAACAIPPL